MSSKRLRIIPLGGLGEVGRNMMVYEYNGEILIVDTGLMFPENDMLGIDYIIPDITYLLERRDKVRGLSLPMVTKIILAQSIMCWRKSRRQSMPPR